MLAWVLSTWAILGGAMKAFSAIKFVSGAGKMFSKITGFGALKGLLIIVLVLGVGGSVYAFWKGYSSLIQEKAILAATISTLETAVQVQDATIEAQETALEEWKIASAKIQVKLQEIADGQAGAREEREKLIEVFSTHDLTRLLDARPELVLRRINDGSDRAFRMLKCASGSGSKDCTDVYPTTSITVAPETGTD